MEDRLYIAIDLKSFYASVECNERNLDPLDTNLVVADESRTDKTICLAVSPSLKSYGLPGRCRLYEVKSKIKKENQKRRYKAKAGMFKGKSYTFSKLLEDKDLAIDYIVAKPRMAYYIEYSTRIYDIYTKYIAPEDIIVYSIDEVFMDVTDYLNTYKMNAHDLAMTIILDVLKNTGITATAGIGTNLYLAKVAMDIVAKHIKADENGVRIAELDEMTYREKLWDHQPLTDFWRVGKGYEKRLKDNHLYTMGDIARFSIDNEDLLYKIFGINAELLIDHAWGYEPCTIKDVKAYKPSHSSIGSGQVLHEPYHFNEAKVVIKEMADSLALELFEKALVTKQIVITVGYDIENLNREVNKYSGEVTIDNYGRSLPKHAHGTINLKTYTNLSSDIMRASSDLFDDIVNKDLLIRRLNIVASDIKEEKDLEKLEEYKEFSLFENYEDIKRDEEDKEKEKKIQKAILDIKKKYGKNAILKGLNLEEGATAKDRNKMVGGHKA